MSERFSVEISQPLSETTPSTILKAGIRFSVMRSHTRIKCLCTWNLSLNSGISFSCITRPRAFFLFSFTEPNKVPLASTFPTRITFIVFTMRGLEIGIPAHITTLSERCTALQSKASFTAF